MTSYCVYPPINLGIASDIPGINVMASSKRIMTTRYGVSARVICSMVCFVIADATNKLTPNGGEQKPIARLIVRTVPKWIGSIPKALAIGSNTGVNMTIAAIVSKNIPTISNAIFINSKITNGLLEILIANSPAC